MKKTGYVHLLLLSAAFSSCRTTSYQQGGCPGPSSPHTSGAYYAQDSCVQDSIDCVQLHQSYMGVMQSIFQNIYSPYIPGATINYKLKLYHSVPGVSKAHFIVRGGFGSSAKSGHS